MDMFFKIGKGIVRMKDKIEVEDRLNKSYLTTSSLNGREKTVLGEYETTEKALEIINKIDEILDRAIKDNKTAISIEIPKEGERDE